MMKAESVKRTSEESSDLRNLNLNIKCSPRSKGADDAN